MKMQLIIEATEPGDMKHLSTIVASVSHLMENTGADLKVKTGNGGDTDVVPLKKKSAKEEAPVKKTAPKGKLKVAEPEDEEDDEDLEDEEVDEEEEDDETEEEDETEVRKRGRGRPPKEATRLDVSKPVKKAAVKEEEAKAPKKVKMEEVQERFRKFIAEHGKGKAAKILGKLGVNAVPELVSEQFSKAIKLMDAEED